ncbi:MAG: DUF6912 family protein [Nocardioidaceae bacterium]
MSTRVYVPVTPALLRDIVTEAGVGPAPFAAHAVTPGLQAVMADGGEEEWEYVACTTAAQSSVGLLSDEDVPRRVVLAVDVSSARPVGGDDVSLVQVDEVVPYSGIAAVLVDDDEAGDAVAAAREAWAAAEAGDPDAEATVERCLDHELGWYATQEIGDLLAGPLDVL